MNYKAKSVSAKPRSLRLPWLDLLDLLAIAAWGVLLLKYWLTGKLNVLLHPNYFWLAIAAGIFLLGLALLKTIQLSARVWGAKKRAAEPSLQHFSLFKPGIGSAILLFTAIVGLQFTPRPFTSDIAIQRGIADTLMTTRLQTQAFRGVTVPEERSITDWVRTLNVYPEPDSYLGQPVNVDGFAVHLSQLPDNYLTISRFIITCCAADAYAIGLPVKLTESRSSYPADQWYRVEGEMITETLNDTRQVVIQATRLSEISEPKNPYDY